MTDSALDLKAFREGIAADLERITAKPKSPAPTPQKINGHASEEPPPALDPNDYADTLPATIDVRPSTIMPAALTTPSAWPQKHHRRSTGLCPRGSHAVR